MQPFNSILLLLLGLAAVHGRPDTWAMESSQRKNVSVTVSSDGQGDSLVATNDDTFCVLNQLDDVTILMSVTSLVNGNEVSDKITAKSGSPACLPAPTDGTNITFNIFIDNKPPIFLFNVKFADIASMDNSCKNYKVTKSGGYPDCTSES
ncbi:unnamed protein product [Ostreobium quekettii]|uniref:Uncharacterized protein n=1 Tax=Ostreobium quekettii TaxID=121088 RepID=A0A8S1IQE8_9CHLO|nr:unnamed protein product [Ostreobium quekettii]|eukprot:evm.model.scf_60.4 EVM.evm.TU.scf_60.4   scf_60:45987-47626(+)